MDRKQRKCRISSKSSDQIINKSSTQSSQKCSNNATASSLIRHNSVTSSPHKREIHATTAPHQRLDSATRLDPLAIFPSIAPASLQSVEPLQIITSPTKIHSEN
jgi:hypothetical protein